MYPNFTGKLYSFQEDVLNWAIKLNKGIIGLDMGLGKTVISVALLCNKQYKRTLIVVPLQIIQQWKTALLRFSTLKDDNIAIYQGKKRMSINFNRHSIILTTYDCVRRDMQDTNSTLYKNKEGFDCMFMDEAHKIRNIKSQTYTSCIQLGEFIENKWLLTGTPIHNDINDFISLCKFINICEKNSCPDKQTLLDLKKLYYYRLMKSNVFLNDELPKKTIHKHILKFNGHSDHYRVYTGLQNNIYNLYEKFLADPVNYSFERIISKILRLRQCCNHIDACLDEYHFKIQRNRHLDLSSPKFNKILDILKGLGTEKIIIFSQWTQSLSILGNFLNNNNINYYQYDGSLNIDDKNLLLNKFRDGSTNVLLMTIASGGVGLDMSYANNIILLDSWWNQALENQAIDRVYRIGQTKNVSVHQLYIGNTIEEWLITIKAEKYEVDKNFHSNDFDIYSPNKSLLNTLLYLHTIPPTNDG